MATPQGDEIEEFFNEVDENKNGRISTKELGRMFKQLGVKLTTDDVKAIVYKYDQDGSRDIDLKEFRALIADVLGANTEYQEAYDAFKVFDANGDNTITLEEARKACDQLPKKLTDDEFKAFMDKLDADGNGVIDFNEFAKAYAVGL